METVASATRSKTTEVNVLLNILDRREKFKHNTGSREMMSTVWAGTVDVDDGKYLN